MSAAEAGQRERRHVVFHGRVQGVCFRATSAQLAGGFRVTGWVRNLADGTVELEAQGERGEVERFIAAISAEFKGYITGIDNDPIAAVAAEQGFTIRH